jgi:hypothetical protein
LSNWGDGVYWVVTVVVTTVVTLPDPEVVSVVDVVGLGVGQ